MPEILVFCLGICLLCQWVQGSPPVSPLLDFVYLVLCWGSWSTWIKFFTGWKLWVYCYTTACRYSVRPAPFVEDAYFVTRKKTQLVPIYSHNFSYLSCSLSPSIYLRNQPWILLLFSILTYEVIFNYIGLGAFTSLW